MDATDIGYAVGIVVALSLLFCQRPSKTKEPIEEKNPPDEEPAKTETSITSGIGVSDSGGKPILLYDVRVEF